MSIYAPKYRAIAVDVSAGNQVFSPPLDKLVVSEVGTVTFLTDTGDTPIVFTVPDPVTDETVTGLPFTLECVIRQINMTGTDVPSANLLGLERI